MCSNGFSINNTHILNCGNGNCVLSIMLAKPVLEPDSLHFCFCAHSTIPQSFRMQQQDEILTTRATH